MNTIQIPAEFVKLLRSALISRLGDPTEDIGEAVLAANREHHPEWFQRPLAALDRYRAALDAIGWSEPDQDQPITLDLNAHREQIAKALRTQLTVEHSYIAENAGKKDEQAQQEYAFAHHNASLIEAFLTVHGLADDA